MNHEDILKRYIDATNTHHFENVRQLLDERAVYWFSDRSCSTLPEIQHYFEEAWKTIQEEVYSAHDIKWITASEQTAVCIYRYEYEGYLKGEWTKGSGRATNVFQKDGNNEWKLVHEHLSAL
ncbi:nuclear transport factor 2 family protein [Neobacillus mesonae]|nr:nuclear transport factor 2 family protein [Neobacillus mesonae]